MWVCECMCGVCECVCVCVLCEMVKGNLLKIKQQEENHCWAVPPTPPKAACRLFSPAQALWPMASWRSLRWQAPWLLCSMGTCVLLRLSWLLSLVLHALTYQQVVALCPPDVSQTIHVCSARILDCSLQRDFLLQPKQSFKIVNYGSREMVPWLRIFVAALV